MKQRNDHSMTALCQQGFIEDKFCFFWEWPGITHRSSTIFPHLKYIILSVFLEKSEISFTKSKGRIHYIANKLKAL